MGIDRTLCMTRHTPRTSYLTTAILHLFMCPHHSVHVHRLQDVCWGAPDTSQVNWLGLSPLHVRIWQTKCTEEPPLLVLVQSMWRIVSTDTFQASTNTLINQIVHSVSSKEHPLWAKGHLFLWAVYSDWLVVPLLTVNRSRFIFLKFFFIVFFFLRQEWHHQPSLDPADHHSAIITMYKIYIITLIYRTCGNRQCLAGHPHA